MIISELKKGTLLIAEPSIIGDMSFNRAVILLADYNAEGSIGFILNKPLEYRLKDLVPETSSEFKVHNGGPVEQDNLYFIHQVPDLVPDSIEISHGVYWGGNFKFVLKLLEEKKLKEGDIRFFLGYSGWESKQLDDELKTNSWIISENIYKNTLINKCCDSFWKDKMVELGGDYSIWSNAPENPSFN